MALFDGKLARGSGRAVEETLLAMDWITSCRFRSRRPFLNAACRSSTPRERRSSRNRGGRRTSQPEGPRMGASSPNLSGNHRTRPVNATIQS